MICDSNYCFLLFDLSQDESNNDCGVFSDSAIGEMMNNYKFSISATSKLTSCSLDPSLDFFSWGRDFPVENLANEAPSRKAC